MRYRIDPRIAELLGRLHGTPIGQALADRLSSLVELAEPSPAGSALASALRAPQWLLDRAADGGIPLTSAGYLKPVDVKACSASLPTMEDWIFEVTYEIHAQPVLRFREFMLRTGLLRKQKGTLVLSKAGRAAQGDPMALWRHLAERLIPPKPAFEESATILALLHFAASADDRNSAATIARTLDLLGWAHADRSSVSNSDVHWVLNDTWAAIGNIGPTAGRRHERRPSRAAISLIRDALLTEQAA